MFAFMRILGSMSCTRPFQSQVLCREGVGWPSKELHRNLQRHLYQGRQNNLYIFPHTRQFADKFSEKGRGEELNYVLKLASEQFMKIKKDRIKEIASDIEKLEEEIKKLESRTSHQSRKTKELLIQELKSLKELLQRFKTSLEK
ncbi:uncharacterized protein LOC6531859 [Drosophila yakuba]|uniref:Uncharacterized protein n=1 Tax=Drosophila yakuba TaxID=7245 RepID=B4P9Q0_DROYA|nr:uncharacterized protein LOC6531859 [Drosophila yakuba]EDW92358.1 uncharacterized protein Dyak_GE11552 [Drosophila yakuba]